MKRLNFEFEVKMDKIPKCYLGMNLILNEEEICISQEGYINQVMKKYYMEMSKPINTPIIDQRNIKCTEDMKCIDFPYREAVGSLLYLSCKTRPDISFAVNF